MLFASNHTGLEISAHGAVFATIAGSAAAPRLERVAGATFPENTVHVSLREQNVLEPEIFVDRIRSAHNLLLSRSGKVSVTLPDSVGRILLLDLEGRFKSRAEALDLIRWKLKKSIPFDLADTHLDYQKLAVRENGDMSLLVALVSKTVISQYEELLLQAGLTPLNIDFNSFNLCRLFDRRMSLSDEGILVFYYGSTLGFIAFSQGVPEFIRVKDLSGPAGAESRVFMEINSSLMVYKNRFPDRVCQTIYCLAAPTDITEFREMVAEASGLEPVLLETKAVITPGNAAPGDQNKLFAHTAAIGAALRNL